MSQLQNGAGPAIFLDSADTATEASADTEFFVCGASVERCTTSRGGKKRYVFQGLSNFESPTKYLIYFYNTNIEDGDSLEIR